MLAMNKRYYISQRAMFWSLFGVIVLGYASGYSVRSLKQVEPVATAEVARAQQVVLSEEFDTCIKSGGEFRFWKGYDKYRMTCFIPERDLFEREFPIPE